jgi:hypothetical protein
MKVQKAMQRLGRTLTHGPFEAQESVYECAGKCRWPTGHQVVQHAACLQKFLMPGSVIGYDVMVFVGGGAFCLSSPARGDPLSVG